MGMNSDPSLELRLCLVLFFLTMDLISLREEMVPLKVVLLPAPIILLERSLLELTRLLLAPLFTRLQGGFLTWAVWSWLEILWYESRGDYKLVEHTLLAILFVENAELVWECFMWTATEEEAFEGILENEIDESLLIVFSSLELPI